MSLAIDMRDVWLDRGGRCVLEAVDLKVEAGDYLAILGPNGSGKTTLLRVMLGLHAPQRGTVEILGRSPRAARGRIGWVPQHATFDPDFPIRVEDVVLMGRLASAGRLRGFDAHDRRVAHGKLELMEVAALARRAIGSLSGGELQRVLIARALAMEPEILLLDEPTASLDERIERGVWEILEELSHHMTLVVVSHDIGAISHWVRSVACLNRQLHIHPSRELTQDMLEATYGCPVDLLAHGQPHRVLTPHEGSEGTP